MKLISASIFSFAIALLALAFGLEGQIAPDAPDSGALAPPAETAPDEGVPPPQSLDVHAREALEEARRHLATALQARTEAEAARDTARAHASAAREAYEATLLDLTEAEDLLASADASPKSRAGRAAQRAVDRAREATLGAERKLEEALQLLERAEADYDQTEATMSQARASLQAVTARVRALPRFTSV